MSEWLTGIFESEALVCDDDVDVTNLVLSAFISVGILVSYLPQHYKIIQRRSSEGLSHWYLFLGATSMCALVVNTFILQFGYFGCCRRLTAGLCLVKLMGLVQIGVQWVAYVVLFTLFVVYWPYGRKYIHLLHDGKMVQTHEWSRVVALTTTLSLFFISISTTAGVLISVYGDAQTSKVSEYYADALGLLSMVCSTVQFMPQLIKTWRSKQVGALSIPSMLIQTPGSFLFVVTLAARPGINITTWITYLITGILQGCLLIMCICWHYRSKRLARQELLLTSETSPLISIDDEDGDGGALYGGHDITAYVADDKRKYSNARSSSVAPSYTLLHDPAASAKSLEAHRHRTSANSASTEVTAVPTELGAPLSGSSASNDTFYSAYSH